MTVPDQIRRHTITQQWVVDIAGKNYIVSRREDPAVPMRVRWSVEGGGNFRSHVCDPDGATHKRVVAWVRTQTGLET